MVKLAMDKIRTGPFAALIALVGGGFVCLATTSAPVTAAPAKPHCVTGPTVEVDLSGQLVKVPVRYRPHISSVVRSSSFRPVNKEEYPKCGGEFAPYISEPVKASSVFIRVQKQNIARDIGSPAALLAVFKFFASRPDRSTDLREIKNFTSRVEKSGRRLEDLPRFAGFYALDRVKGGQLYVGPFMAVSDGIKTPAGNPIVFKCGGSLVAPLGSKGSRETSAMCTVHYNLSRNIVIQYVFSDARISIDNWVELDRTLRAFVEGWIGAPKR